MARRNRELFTKLPMETGRRAIACSGIRANSLSALVWTDLALVTFLSSSSRRKPTQQVVVYLDLRMPLLPTRINEQDQTRNHSHLTPIYMVTVVSISLRGQTIIETMSYPSYDPQSDSFVCCFLSLCFPGYPQ